ncbi:MAG: hypothetical protein FD180_125 [Planctomycetota bacterium]|nr:MAG: hypothetical protein FD180_125 [Planctomycetota bacterium]
MRLALLFSAAAASAILAALMATADGTPPPHVTRLDTLVADLRAQTLAGLRFNGTGDVLNDHVNGHLILWKEDGNPFAENRSLCNQLVTIALKTGWGTTDEAWKAKTGYNYPSSEHIYEAIRDGKGFVRITSLDGVLAGDVLAWWYIDDPSTGYPSTTGHSAVVRSLGPVVVYKFPKKSTTVRFRDLEVFDSSNSGHSMDTRSFLAGELGAGSAAAEWKGAGRGWMRIYVDAAGNYLGYTWSLTGTKTQPPGTPPSYSYYSKQFKSEALRHFIVGRYLP